MTLSRAATNILNQLAGLVQQIHENDFTKPSAVLNGSTIGGHVPHTIEFFLCFESSYRTGVINYDNRGHDKLLESYKDAELEAIGQIVPYLQVGKDFGIAASRLRHAYSGRFNF